MPKCRHAAIILVGSVALSHTVQRMTAEIMSDKTPKAATLYRNTCFCISVQHHFSIWLDCYGQIAREIRGDNADCSEALVQITSGV
jgi:hypothetical protein